MNKTLAAFNVVIACLAMPALAQQNRAKLDAPGKVAFGSSYDQATNTLGKDAEPYELNPPQAGIKALSCDKCASLPNVEGFTMYFQDKGGLIRLEAFAMAGMFKSAEDCQKADTEMMPKLVELYGRPDSNANVKKGVEAQRIASFKFADGAVIEHVSNIFKPGRPCTYTVLYQSRAGAR